MVQLSRNCCVAIPHGVMALSAVCDCGITHLQVFTNQKIRLNLVCISYVLV